MPRADIIENPEGGTSGLTSACQLVDITEVLVRMPSNSTSVAEEISFAPFCDFEHFERFEKFWNTLGRTFEKNWDLLNKLSKY